MAACENCGERIVGAPGYTGSTRAIGNGFYKGSRPTATCRACAEWLAEFNADSAYRARVEEGRTYAAALRQMGQTDEQVRTLFLGSGWGPALLAEVL